MRRMLLDFPDQLWHCIPIPFTASLVQLLDVLGGLCFFPLWHVVSVAVVQTRQIQGRASPTLMLGRWGSRKSGGILYQRLHGFMVVENR
jgi:hypothetical protein